MQKNIVFLLVLTFILVIAWVGFNIYHDSTTSTINQDLQLIITPLNPTFDEKAVQMLAKRQQVTPLYALAPKPDLKASLPATPSGTIQPQTLIATRSGEFVSSSTPTPVVPANLSPTGTSP